jgi:hypothetical protein
MSEKDLSADATALDNMFIAMAKDLGLPGWTYRDISWVTPDVWNQFLDIVGMENCKILAKSTDGNKRCRGQVLISPDGMSRLRAAIAETAAKIEQMQESGNPKSVKEEE